MKYLETIDAPEPRSERYRIGRNAEGWWWRLAEQPDPAPLTPKPPAAAEPASPPPAEVIRLASEIVPRWNERANCWQGGASDGALAAELGVPEPWIAQVRLAVMPGSTDENELSQSRRSARGECQRMLEDFERRALEALASAIEICKGELEQRLTAAGL